MKYLILIACAAIPLAACGDTDTAIDTTADATEGYDPPDAGEAPTMDGSMSNAAPESAAPVSGDFPADQVGDGEGGTNPTDTDVGLDDSADAEESY